MTYTRLVKYVVMAIFAQSIFCQTVFSTEVDFHKEGISFVEESPVISDGPIQRRVVNTRFEFPSDDVLLEISENLVSIHGQDGCDGKIDVTAYRRENKQFNSVAWSLHERGERAELFGRYLKIVRFGGGGSEDSTVFYNSETGRKIMNSSSDLFPLNNFRIVGYQSSKAEGIPEYTPDKEELGVMLYATNEGSIVSQLAIFGGKDDPGWTPEISFKVGKEPPTKVLPPMNTSLDCLKCQLTGFSIILTFDENQSVVIPVIQDSLDITHASVPRGMRIQLKNIVPNDSYLRESRFKDLGGKSKEDLRLLRNEIYARHGNSFDDSNIRAYFKGQSWYKEVNSRKVLDVDLSNTEIDMLKKIGYYEGKGKQ